MTKCSIPHCDYNTFARGFCSRHYQAERKYGDPLVVRQKQHHGLTLSERFWLYVRKKDGCWEWLSYKDNNGYGRINYGGKPFLAHRLSYMLKYGDIPAGKVVCHRCDNPGCTNPDHLFLGTQADNVEDMHAKGRATKRGLKGSAHHQARISEDDVRAIRGSGMSGAELAEKYGMSRTNIYDILNGKTWRHVK